MVPKHKSSDTDNLNIPNKSCKIFFFSLMPCLIRTWTILALQRSCFFIICELSGVLGGKIVEWFSHRLLHGFEIRIFFFLVGTQGERVQSDLLLNPCLRGKRNRSIPFPKGIRMK